MQMESRGEEGSDEFVKSGTEGNEREHLLTNLKPSLIFVAIYGQSQSKIVNVSNLIMYYLLNLIAHNAFKPIAVNANIKIKLISHLSKMVNFQY
jgi:hypothetical protein